MTTIDTPPNSDQYLSTAERSTQDHRDLLKRADDQEKLRDWERRREAALDELLKSLRNHRFAQYNSDAGLPKDADGELVRLGDRSLLETILTLTDTVDETTEATNSKLIDPDGAFCMTSEQAGQFLGKMKVYREMPIIETSGVVSSQNATPLPDQIQIFIQKLIHPSAADTPQRQSLDDASVAQRVQGHIRAAENRMRNAHPVQRGIDFISDRASAGTASLKNAVSERFRNTAESQDLNDVFGRHARVIYEASELNDEQKNKALSELQKLRKQTEKKIQSLKLNEDDPERQRIMNLLLDTFDKEARIVLNEYTDDASEIKYGRISSNASSEASHESRQTPPDSAPVARSEVDRAMFWNEVVESLQENVDTIEQLSAKMAAAGIATSELTSDIADRIVKTTPSTDRSRVVRRLMSVNKNIASYALINAVDDFALKKEILAHLLDASDQSGAESGIASLLIELDLEEQNDELMELISTIIDKIPSNSANLKTIIMNSSYTLPVINRALTKYSSGFDVSELYAIFLNRYEELAGVALEKIHDDEILADIASNSVFPNTLRAQALIKISNENVTAHLTDEIMQSQNQDYNEIVKIIREKNPKFNAVNDKK